MADREAPGDGLSPRTAITAVLAAIGLVAAGLVAAAVLTLSTSGPGGPDIAHACAEPPCVTVPATIPATTRPPGPDPDPEPPGRPQRISEIYTTPACPGNGPPDNDQGNLCGAFSGCPDPAENNWRRFRRYLESEGPPRVWGPWEEIEGGCMSFEAAEQDPDAPQVTPAMVLEQIRNGHLPHLDLEAQPPNGRTLVNFDTIFYTEPRAYTETLEFFGGAVLVDVKGEATGYRWIYGDGNEQITSHSGARYQDHDPDHTITHAYRTPGPVTARLEVTWGNFQYLAPDGTWHSLDGVATTQSAPMHLDVLESIARLYATG